MFMAPGSDTVVRVNGCAVVTVDSDVIGQFEHQCNFLRMVIVIRVGEVYFQCAKALRCSRQ